MSDFDGLNLNLGNLARVSTARTRSISAENFTGEKGKGGMATTGQGAGRRGRLGKAGKFRPRSSSSRTAPSLSPRSPSRVRSNTSG